MPQHHVHAPCGVRCRRKKPFPLYHWSPASRRKSIQRRGLIVGSPHAVHSKGWRASYLCFSDSPSFAWAYSANTTRKRQNWDLWMVWSTHVPGLSYRYDHVAQLPAEYRSTGNVPKKHLWHVASRRS